jgi:Cof subfamily protein (haloacid dehalogenase superfamily)
MIKAVFFDIDGTLLSHKTNSVPASAVRALEELREKGILTFIATGRHLPELKKLRPLEGLEFDGMVTLNGQYSFDRRGLIYHCPIAQRDIAILLDFLKENPYPCILVEEDQMYINFHNARVEKVQAMIHSEMPPIGDLNRGYTHPIYQAILYMSEEDQRKLPPMPGIRLTSWTLGGADLIPATGGKAAGIAKVLQHYGIDKSETMAFGDGQNDVDMFAAVGTAVAMGNACREAKEAAHYITDPVDQDGIYNALKHFHVI